MITDKIKRAIDLVKKTGEKIILFEDDNSEGIVVMNLEDYENLVAEPQTRQKENDNKISNLTEDELIDKINRNIAIWKNQNQELDSEKVIDSFLDLSEELDKEEAEENPEEDNFYYYPDPEDKISFSEVTSQEEEEKFQSEFEKEKQEEIREQEEQKEEQKTEPVEQEEIGSKRSNWEIPVNIKRNAEEVDE